MKKCSGFLVGDWNAVASGASCAGHVSAVASSQMMGKKVRDVSRVSAKRAGLFFTAGIVRWADLGNAARELQIFTHGKYRTSCGQ